MWYENAPSSKIINGEVVLAVAPTQEVLASWVSDLITNKELQAQVWHRFVMTRRGKTLVKWAKAQFFFQNATKAQIQAVSDAVMVTKA